MEESNILF